MKKGKNRKELTSFVLTGIGVLSEDPKTISNTLNKYFSSIGQQLATHIPELNTSFSDYLDPPLQNSF